MKKISFTCSLVLAIALLACAQNKVQYVHLDWSINQSAHFKIHSHQNTGAISLRSGRFIEQCFDTLSRTFKINPPAQFPLILYGSPNLFSETNVILEPLSEGVGGFTEIFKNRIVIPFNGSYRELAHVLNHELVHAFQFAILYDGSNNPLTKSAGVQMPLWFAEGMAEYLSRGWDEESDMFLMDQAIYGNIPKPGPMLGGYMAYKGGQSFFLFLNQTHGHELFIKFLRAYRISKSVDESLKKCYGASLEELGDEWIRQLRRIYWPEIGRRDEPRTFARAMSDHTKDRSFFNLQPRLSPNGEKIAYFSDINDYTAIRITTRKGKLIRSISQVGWNGYFDSFHPFRSGICWSPDGEKIAFVTKTDGRDNIRIVQVASGKITQTITTPFDGLASPDWSPDGKTIVFCALNRDQADLFQYSFSTDSTIRLTNDVLAESSPRYSPDGAIVVYSAHSGLSDSGMSQKAPDNLYTLDLATKTTKVLLATQHTAKSPVFSPDGRGILFVSNANGIDNLYYAPLDSMNSMHPITNIIGGISSPDWSRTGDRVSFSLFNKSGYDVWLMKNPLLKMKKQPLALTRYKENLAFENRPLFAVPVFDTLGDSLPQKISSKKDTGAIALNKSVDLDTIAADTSVPITKPETERKKIATVDTTTRPYVLTFSPDQISAGLGYSSQYGYAVGQGMISLSDILGDHRIILAGDLQGRIDQYGHFYGAYYLLKYRLDAGIALFYSREATSQSLFANEVFLDQQFGGSLMLAYPFSPDARLDLNVYYNHINREPFLYINDAYAAQPRQVYDVCMPSLNFSFDNALWGLTGPVNGVRANISMLSSPQISSLSKSFISMETDVRAYWHIFRRFVWANRVALGGSVALRSGEEPARRYFLGGVDTWVNNSVSPSGFTQNQNNIFYFEFVTPFRGFRYFDFSGTRYSVLNSEFRFPFIKEISIVWPFEMALRYINGVVFTDVGNCWFPNEEYKSVPLPKTMYGSFGYGLRANLGFLVLKYDRGYGTDGEFVYEPIDYWSLGADF